MPLKSLPVLALLLFATISPAQDFTAEISRLPLHTKDAGEGDFKLGPQYSPAPELTPDPSVPKGTVVHFVMHSADSKLYPGISRSDPGKIVPYDRRVTVYIPAGYEEGSVAPFFVSQDSLGSGQVPTMLDNMIAQKRLPRLVGIFIDSGGSDSTGSERGWEYDTLSGQYAEFIETEVLPKISQDYHVRFTKDPNGRMVMGGSSGGACAFTMAWYHPELYHRVLTYSGTYVNQQWPPMAASIHGAWEYHDHFISESKKKPLRIWLQVGDHDLRFTDPESTYHNWVMANFRMAAALKSKGYPYQFVVCQEAGHVDWKAVMQTLPQAFEWVWKGYH